MTTYDSVFDCLQQFLTRTFTIPYQALTSDQQLQQTLGLSEWEFTEVIVELETRFGVILPDETLSPMLTVGELCTLISQYARLSGQKVQVVN